MSHACSLYNNPHIQFSPIPLLLTCSSCQWMGYFCQWMVYARHVSDFGLKGFLGVVLLASCSVYFGYTECIPCIGLHFPPEFVPSIGLHLPCIQSNDLSYTVFVCQVSSPMNGANTYIMHSESRLCRFAVAPLRFLRSDELFQHHTSSSRSRKDCSHKRRHQGSR